MTENSHRDRLEIRELVARYSHAVNDADFPAWADCFTRDGVFVGAYDRFDAHGDLDRFASESATLMSGWPNLRLQFTDVLPTVVSDGTATSRCNLLMTSTDALHVPRIVFLAHYDDRLARVEGRWLFEERRVTVVGREGPQR